MYKTIIFACVLCVVIIEARPRWQFLPEVPGYVPVYIRNGDTPLEEINPELAEAFHALPAGRSVGKQVEAAPDTPEAVDQATPKEIPVIVNFDTRSFDNEVLDKNEKDTLDAIPAQSR